MDHDHYGLDGTPIYSQGVDVDPVTGEPLGGQGASGRFAFEPNTIVFAVLAVSFVVFIVIEARIFG
ncbi:DUF4346 domain-containing protein [Novosphingobium sp. KCTC 2891]|uniref:DUF4346 domain-containing protein n=1 Tax=Novosphingobium sp. KCTC 2891 TaxID=2989730 RepID=UPI0022237271|nr:DUF4346 domain-containing protein [Novosphingobium sp. KCTC 2891]MCW1384603.1 DUF4346 domain-containing protein [Novosphingobium sp. KCTC 2891]